MILPADLLLCRSSPRVKSLVDALQSALLNMGIQLGGGNVGVAKHELYRPEIRAVFKQVRGKGMAQYMGTDLFVNGGLAGNLPEYLPVAGSCHGLTLTGDEQGRTCLAHEQQGPDMIQVLLQEDPGLLANGHQSLLAALAQHPQIAALPVDADQRQLHQLRYP